MFEVLNTAVDIFDRISKWNTITGNSKAKLRLLYLECQKNLTLIDSLNLNKNDEIDNDYISIINCIETDILEMIFFEGKESKKFLEILKKTIIKKNIENEVDGIEEKSMKALTFVYIKIDVLKKLTTIKNEGIALRKINFKVRLKNIRDGLLKIVKTLKKFDEVKAIR